jgi:hypothetical protein
MNGTFVYRSLFFLSRKIPLNMQWKSSFRARNTQAWEYPALEMLLFYLLRPLLIFRDSYSYFTLTHFCLVRTETDPPSILFDAVSRSV